VEVAGEGARRLHHDVARVGRSLHRADDLRLSAYLDERFSSASLPTEEEVRQVGEAARARLTAEHRQTLVNAWIAELRRRTEITVLP